MNGASCAQEPRQIFVDSSRLRGIYSLDKRESFAYMKSCRIVGLFVLTCASVFAQATAQIQGVIQDATGSGIPGAEVKATQTETGIVRTTSSGPEGTYVMANLPIGPYKVEVSKSGF